MKSLTMQNMPMSGRPGPPPGLLHSPLLPPPDLTIELIESILVHVPLRFPLSKFRQYNPRQLGMVHDQCTAALTVLSLPRHSPKVFVPRLRNGPELIIANAPRFGADYLQALYARGFRFPSAPAFAAAAQLNRVDVLKWLAAEVPVPRTAHNNEWCDHPVLLALDANAWDALDFMALARLAQLCDNVFTDEELADLVRTRGEREVQFVALWLRSGYEIDCYESEVIQVACELGYVSVLEAWVEGGGGNDWFDEEEMDDLCARTVRAGEKKIVVLDWMVQRDCVLPNVAEHASEIGDVQVLEWWKRNKARIDLAVQEVHDPTGGPFVVPLHPQPQAAADPMDVDDDSDQYHEMDVADLEIDPEWLSEIKHGFCLDLAREMGHQHVVDWWMQNLDLLPIPNSVEMVDVACRNGDLEFLKIWNQRRGASTRRFDCNASLWEATVNGHMHVLEWWVNSSGIRLHFDVADVVHAALGSDHWQIAVHWWINQPAVKTRLAECAVLVNRCADAAYLERWNLLGRCLPFDVTEAMCFAAQSGRFDILDWWINAPDLSLDAVLGGGKPALVDAASAAGQVDVLHWMRLLCLDRNVSFCYSEKALDDLEWDTTHTAGCAPSAQFQVVKWWCQSGLDLKYTEAAFENAVFALSHDEVKWWVKNRLPLPMPDNLCKETFQVEDMSVWSTGGPLLVYSHWARKDMGLLDG